LKLTTIKTEVFKKMLGDLIELPGEYIVFDPIWLIGAIILGGIFLVIWIFIVQYIYKDAVDKGLNADIWLLIILLSPIISWIIYFIVRNYRKT